MSLFIPSMLPAQQKTGVDLNIAEEGMRYNDTSAHVRTIDLKSNFPLYTTGNSRLIGNFSFTNEHLDNFPGIFGSDLTGLSAGLSWNMPLGSRQQLVLSGGAGLYSDLKVWTGKAIRENARVIYIAHVSQRLAIGLGMDYRDQFFGNQLIPIVAVIYSRAPGNPPCYMSCLPWIRTMKAG